MLLSSCGRGDVDGEGGGNIWTIRIVSSSIYLALRRTDTSVRVRLRDHVDNCAASKDSVKELTTTNAAQQASLRKSGLHPLLFARFI